MDGEVGLVVEATRQASKFLLRDYFELENSRLPTDSRVPTLLKINDCFIFCKY